MIGLVVVVVEGQGETKLQKELLDTLKQCIEVYKHLLEGQRGIEVHWGHEFHKGPECC